MRLAPLAFASRLRVVKKGRENHEIIELSLVVVRAFLPAPRVYETSLELFSWRFYLAATGILRENSTSILLFTNLEEPSSIPEDARVYNSVSAGFPFGLKRS